MGRKNGTKNEETMRIRMSTELLKRIQAAKVPSGWGEEADSSFARHLLILGVVEVEKTFDRKFQIEQLLRESKITMADIMLLQQDIEKNANKRGVSVDEYVKEINRIKSVLLAKHRSISVEQALTEISSSDKNTHSILERLMRGELVSEEEREKANAIARSIVDDTIAEAEALEAIRNVPGKGRPKKPKPEK